MISTRHAFAADVKQDILLKVAHIIRAHGAEIAFPTLPCLPPQPLTRSRRRADTWHFLGCRLIAGVLACLAVPASAAEPPPLPSQLSGDVIEYTIRPGDCLIAIGARFGIEPRVLARTNRIPFDAIIHPGQRLEVDRRHIVPAGVDDGLLVNIPQRMLFHFSQGELVASYPVGLGKPTWPTPVGAFRIVTRERDKTWVVPKSIQEAMRREGKELPDEVPPGPDNPLGAHWLGLAIWGCGIHGTIAPASVYHFQSHGCIRMHPDDIAELFGRVKIGTRGRLVYQTVLLARSAEDRLLLEAHPDVYRRDAEPLASLREQAQAHGLVEAIDWALAEAAIAARDGRVHEIGRQPAPVAE